MNFKIKSCVIMFILMMAMSAYAVELETVHLKNGSVINGVIVEQIPGESLKIKTRDGNIFHCDMSEVVKITKEARTTGYGNFFGRFDGGAVKGYRGFFEAGYTIGVGDVSEGRLDITTSHGYQICPYFFAGIGAGFNYYTSSSVIGVPLFADLRADILNNKITPFIDFKIGYSVADISGFYMSPSVGCRFGFGNNLGMHISVGYTMQKADVTYVSYVYGYYYSSYYSRTTKENVGGVTLKLGFEF